MAEPGAEKALLFVKKEDKFFPADPSKTTSSARLVKQKGEAVTEEIGLVATEICRQHCPRDKPYVPHLQRADNAVAPVSMRRLYCLGPLKPRPARQLASEAKKKAHLAAADQDKPKYSELAAKQATSSVR